MGLDKSGIKRTGSKTDSFTGAHEAYREVIRDNLGSDLLIERCPYDGDRVNEIIDLMVETVCSSRRSILIAGDEYPAELVKAKFLKLNSGHIEYVLECLKKTKTEIHNIKKYLLATLFNAPSTIDSYYSSRVSHDMAHGVMSFGGAP
jgi:hypothetical protein